MESRVEARSRPEAGLRYLIWGPEVRYLVLRPSLWYLVLRPGVWYDHALVRPRGGRGATLLEMLVGLTMLSVMIGVILLIYVTGAGAWSKGDAQAELLGDLQAATSRMASELERASYDSLTVDLYDVSFLSALRSDGTQSVDPNGVVQWDHYVVYYRDSSQNALMRQTVALQPGDPQISTPAPLSQYGANPAPTSSYCTGGSLAAHGITALSFQAQTRLVQMAVEAQKPRYGRRDPERMSQLVTVRVRN